MNNVTYKPGDVIKFNQLKVGEMFILKNEDAQIISIKMPVEIVKGQPPYPTVTEKSNAIRLKDGGKRIIRGYELVIVYKLSTCDGGTDFYDLEDVVRGYASLTDGCGIFGTMTSERFPSFTHMMLDGFPVITYKKLAGHWQTYWVVKIEKYELPNDARITYSLDEIKTIFKQILVGNTPKFKTVEE